MDKKLQIQSAPSLSQLDRFTLSFEYDKTLREVKYDVRARTDQTL